MKDSRELKQAAAERAAAAAEAGASALQEALEHASVLLAEAQKKAGPTAKRVRMRTADFAAKRLDDWEPKIRGTLDRVAPAVEAARERVADDYLPKLQTLLHEAAEHPKVTEATKRGEAAVQALKGELEPNRPKKKKSWFKGLLKGLGVIAVVAGAAAAARQFLTPKDDGWTAHEPSRAYVNNNSTFATAADVAPQPKDEEPSEVIEEETAAEEPAVAETEALVEDVAEATEEQTSTYGEGSYVGTTPPERFFIKGNERSMKYHLPGSGGYERTIAEVWFASEEAAEAAGFTRAQR